MDFYKGLCSRIITTQHTALCKLAVTPARLVEVFRWCPGAPRPLAAMLVLAALLVGAGAGHSQCLPPRIESYTRTVNHGSCDTNCETLSVVVGDSGRFLYQWYFSRNFIGLRTRLNRETNATLTLCSITESDQGEYDVSITNVNNVCSWTNLSMRLYVRADTNPPTITCPPDRRVVSCSTNGARVLYSLPTAVDDYDASPTVTCTPASSSVFPLGTTTVRCTATDDCTNRSTCTFQVTVLYDIFAPAIHCAGDLTVVTCSAIGTNVAFPPPSTLDDYDTNVTVTCTPASGSLFPVGTTVVNCLAMDNCGRTNSCRFQVIVRADTTPPVITCPGNYVVGCCDLKAIQVFYPSLSATDDTDPNVTITCNPTNGSTLSVGSHAVRCTAWDDCGHRDDCSFTVQVMANTNTIDPKIASITPSLVSTQGGTALLVAGERFGASDEVRLNGRPIVSQIWMSDTAIMGVTPPLPSGSITVTVFRCSEVRPVATHANLGYAAPPPRLTSIEPAKVFARGGTRVIVHGENLRPETEFHIALAGVDSSSNKLSNVLVSPDGLSAMGQIPALPSGQAYGPRAILAEDTRGQDLLVPGITYMPNPVETEPVLLAMHQLEQDSLRIPAMAFRKGFPSSMHVRLPMAGAQPEERARNFLRNYKTLLQQPNPDSDLVLRKINRGFVDHVRFRQQYQGVPVYGGELVVTLKSNDVRMTSGELLPTARLVAAGLNTTPTLSALQGEAMAQALLNRPGAPTLRPSELLIFDRSLLTEAPSEPHLAWRVFLGGGSPGVRKPHKELFLDAHTGQLLLALKREQPDGGPLDGLDLQLTDAENEANPSSDVCYNTSDDTDIAYEDWWNSDYTGRVEAELANLYAQNAYAYFHTNYAWHSYDNAGSQLEVFIWSTVDNASWSQDCELISIREGWVDYEVMVHEFTHGVIQHSSELIYAYQMGALNEHYADMMALAADWQAGDTNWTVCENRTGFSYEVRDFEYPSRPTFADYNESNCGDADGDDPPDYGCVHDNSEIPSRAAYYMVNGFESNHVQMFGISMEQLRVLKWEALLNLPEDAKFDTAAWHEIGMAQLWAENGINGFIDADVCAVRNGWALVGLVAMTGMDCYGPWYVDTDGDHVYDWMDNCPHTPNPNQEDYDGDGIGDVCDNCPHNQNKDQSDIDGDGIGDVCDPDIDGDGCLNEVDQHPTNSMVAIGSYFSVCCANAAKLGPEGDDSDHDGLLNCEDDDDDNDGILDVDDPCPTGPSGPLGTCSEYADCPCTPNNWRVTCAGGGCRMYFAKFSWVLNPDPATDVVFEHVEYQNQRIYLFSSLGNSAAQSAQAIAQGVSGGMKMAGDRRRLEIWAYATATVPAHLVEIVTEFDPGEVLWQQLTLGPLLTLSLPADSLTPLMIGATWRLGSDPADAATDTDKDGMPDGWELRHGLNPRNYADADADADGDGASNRHEFLAGTDPQNPVSCFRLLEVGWLGQNVKLRFNTELGRQYQLQRTLSLDPKLLQWTAVSVPGTPGLVTGTGGAMEVSDTLSGTAKGFYRLTLLPE